MTVTCPRTILPLLNLVRHKDCDPSLFPECPQSSTLCSKDVKPELHKPALLRQLVESEGSVSPELALLRLCPPSTSCSQEGRQYQTGEKAPDVCHVSHVKLSGTYGADPVEELQDNPQANDKQRR